METVLTGDTLFEILLQLNIKELRQLSINKEVYNILKSRDFWLHYFNNHNLILPYNVNFNKLTDWVDLYFTIIATKILTIIKNKKLERDNISTIQLINNKMNIDKF